MKIIFYGAAREVTGSCFLLEIDNKRLLIDCGLFQGSKFADDRNREPFPFDPESIDALLLTHAHLDHLGRVPKLVKHGFSGPIFATKPTADLAPIMWEDALEVMRHHVEETSEPLIFDEADIKNAVKRFDSLDYNQEINLDQGITATWHDAGHILGSAFIEIVVNGQRIVFSGDLGNRDVPIIREPEPLPQTDFLVMESTYGAFLHEDPESRKEKLRDEITRTVKEGGVVLIPAFALERVQEILYELNELVEGGQIPRVPIFLDSPLAIRATEVFRDYENYYDKEAFAKICQGDDLFNFPGLEATLSRDESRSINEVAAPKVIIAGAGMMTGGRIFHHLCRYLSDPRSSVLVVGYQAENTLGRRLIDGAPKVKIFKKPFEVKAHIRKIGGYSSHADQSHLIDWAVSVPTLPKRIFLIHGEPPAQKILAEKIKERTGLVVEAPAFGTTHEVDRF